MKHKQTPELLSPQARAEAAAFPAVGTTLSPYARNYAYTAAPVPGRARRSWRKLLKLTLAALAITVLLAVGWVGYKFVTNAYHLFGSNLFGLLHSTPLKGQSTGRVNILLAGNSVDDPGHQGAQLTDSIMLISIDTRNHTAFLMSIPRDLWVNIPGYGYQKINAAYEYGRSGNFNQPGYPPGGMGLLEKVVSQDFGVPIDYYALIDYSAFRDAVNAVGGISVNIHSSDPRGLYDPSIDWTTHGPLVRLSNGPHHLNGQQALDLARARGDAYGSYGFPLADFNRTANQRMMLIALENKVLSAGIMTNPVALGKLMDSIGQNVKTDLTASDARSLYQLVKPISNANIKSISLNNVNGHSLLRNYTTYDGQSALIPAAGRGNFSAIQTYVSQLIAPPPTQSAAAAQQSSLSSGSGTN